jgi:hypothetical protein
VNEACTSTSSAVAQQGVPKGGAGQSTSPQEIGSGGGGKGGGALASPLAADASLPFSSSDVDSAAVVSSLDVDSVAPESCLLSALSSLSSHAVNKAKSAIPLRINRIGRSSLSVWPLMSGSWF